MKVDTENIEIIGTITNKTIAITLNGYIILNIKHDNIFVKIKTILTINIRIYSFMFYLVAGKQWGNPSWYEFNDNFEFNYLIIINMN